MTIKEGKMNERKKEINDKKGTEEGREAKGKKFFRIFIKSG